MLLDLKEKKRKEKRRYRESKVGRQLGRRGLDWPPGRRLLTCKLSRSDILRLGSFSGGGAQRGRRDLLTTAAACAARTGTNRQRGGRPLQNYPNQKSDNVSRDEWELSSEAPAADAPRSNKIKMLFGPRTA